MEFSNKIINSINNQDCDNPMEFYKLPQDEQETIKAWIDIHVKPYVIKSKTYKTRNTSYNIKHDYEYYTGDYYINGVFKGALHACGLEIENYYEKNWAINTGGKYETYRTKVLRKR